MSEHLERVDVVGAVDRLVDELLEKAGIEAPPVDAIALARKHLGMIVCLDQKQQQRGRAQRAGGKPQIYLRPEPTEERHQWTVAHEIGEHVKAILLERLGIAPEETPPMSGESLANLFAGRLLVPTCWLAGDAPSLAYDVLHMKKRYHTASHEVIAWRFLDLPEACIITIVDNDGITRRRSNCWRVKSKILEPVERQCQRQVSQHGRPRLVRAGGWTVQGWPVHQADWRREILRSVVDED
jgi:Zn-dependent peptidase ImmA (M78 family)